MTQLEVVIQFLDGKSAHCPSVMSTGDGLFYRGNLVAKREEDVVRVVTQCRVTDMVEKLQKLTITSKEEA